MTTLPDQTDWAGLSPAARLDIARAIEKRLAGAVRVAAEDGNASGPVFVSGGRRFVFVPGGETRLGFDAAAWRPTPEQQESFDESAEEYGFEETLQAYLAARTTPPRSFRAPPMLVATEAEELGWKAADADDPRVLDARRKYPDGLPGKEITVHDRRGVMRIRQGADGEPVFQIGEPIDRAAFESALHADGFRLPSADEWEWLCGAGAETLFRWGDDCPCDRYPTDMSRDEADWRRAWVLSRGKLAEPSEPFQWEVTTHRAANRHGLRIAFDPYRVELVQEPRLTRGGDGGGGICGGEGFFLGWLPLATAYLDRAVSESLLRDGPPLGFSFARPVIDLGGLT
jgi:hypothetical protein